MEQEGGRILERPAPGLDAVTVDVGRWTLANETTTALGLYGLALLCTLAAAALAGGGVRFTSGTAALIFGGGVLLWRVTGDVRAGRLPVLAWLAVACCGVTALVLLITGGLPVRPYGDGAVLAQFVADGRGVPRWLLGSTAAAVLHAATWELVPVQAALPIALRSSASFLAIVGVAVMVGGTWAVWRQWPGRLAVLLPACTHIWALFASGYVEYYPLIAPLYLAVLAWLFEARLEERTPDQVGAIAGLLPIIYLGFAPLAGWLLVVYAVARPRAVARAVVVAAASAAIAVAVCWPEGLVNFIRTLISIVPVGDAYLHPRYAGQEAGPSSMMFSWSAAASAAHARDLWFLLVRAGGWWSVPLLLLAIGWRVGERGSDRASWLADARVWLGTLLVLSYTYYFVFMIPRLGLTEDIDLFFPTYVLLAFMAGRLLDGSADAGRRHRWRTTAVLAVALASLACVAPALLTGTLDGPH